MQPGSYDKGEYGPFPSSPQPPFQSEEEFEVFVMKISIHIEIATNYHNNNFALRLALKERLRGTRKWPITVLFNSQPRIVLISSICLLCGGERRKRCSCCCCCCYVFMHKCI